MRIKRSGFTTLECVISLFIVSMIVFMITSTLHNNIILLKKNNCNRQMLYTAKQKTINNFKVKTLVTPISYYNCYDLKVKISYENREMELSTYVTKKE